MVRGWMCMHSAVALIPARNNGLGGCYSCLGLLLGSALAGTPVKKLLEGVNMATTEALIPPEQATPDIPSNIFAAPTTGQLDVTLANLDSKKAPVFAERHYDVLESFWCHRMCGQRCR